MFGIGAPELMILAIPLVIIYIIVTFFLPFFVLRIRREAIKTNKLLAEIAAGLGGENSEIDPTIKYCVACGAKNRVDDTTCLSCSEPI